MGRGRGIRDRFTLRRDAVQGVRGRDHPSTTAARERGRLTGLFAGNAELARRYDDVDLLGVDSDVSALRVGIAQLFRGPEPD